MMANKIAPKMYTGVGGQHQPERFKLLEFLHGRDAQPFLFALARTTGTLPSGSALGGLCAYGKIVAAMNLESIPKFTGAAAKLWATIPAEANKRLLANVWCGTCRHAVTL